MNTILRMLGLALLGWTFSAVFITGRPEGVAVNILTALLGLAFIALANALA